MNENNALSLVAALNFTFLCLAYDAIFPKLQFKSSSAASSDKCSAVEEGERRERMEAQTIVEESCLLKTKCFTKHL